jgi:hypothetical protein
MKNYLLLSAFLLFALSAFGQNKNNRFGITAGGSVQHYNGNLGNSFFKFNSVWFGGGVTNFGVYINKSLDFDIGGSVCLFGYHPEHANGEEVPLELRCPGCKGLGMGELRSLMFSGNMAIKYKFANDIFLREDSKFAPYAYLGLGFNHLIDNMKRQCVNVGNHVSINAGAGIKYNITERFNIGYNLGVGVFPTKKVYNTNGLTSDADAIVSDAGYIKAQRRKDMYLQNAISLGINFN